MALDVRQEAFLSEEVILVDVNDRALGHMSKKQSHLLPGSLHRAFSLFLFNPKGELLLQQRAASKITFPLVWSNTVCSHPLWTALERVEDDAIGVKRAAVRKTEQEIGVNISEDMLTYVTRIRYSAPCDDKWGETEVDYCLFAKEVVETNPNPNEVAAVKYVSQEELRRMLEEDGKSITLSPWFKRITVAFLFGWWDKLLEGKLNSCIDHEKITFLQ